MNIAASPEPGQSRVQQGMIAVLFEKERKGVRPSIMNLKNEYREIVRTSFNAAMSGNLGLEIVVVTGDTARIRSLEQQMLAQRGVQSVRLTLIPSGSAAT
jgi:CopG family nickel-responsive transcriptional regulator